MTGLELLREEMLKRGMTKSQVESKVAAVVLDILANTGNVYSDTYKAEQRLAELRREQDRIEAEIERGKKDIANLRDITNDLERARRKDWEEKLRYIERFNEGLEKCESQADRDAMRRAQVFVNSVSIDTKYDNTAFIIGLASILSNGSIEAIDALKKINPKLGNMTVTKSGDVYEEMPQNRPLRARLW